MEGMIFDIKRFAIHDGPGIRTTLFFKGCTLHCKWCHNPESQDFGTSEIQQTRKLDDKTFTISHTVGERYTVDRVMAEIEKDYLFFDESHGGVTFSGGDPMTQPLFLLEILRRCRERRIHTCIDTAGAYPVTYTEEICRFTDLFLYDIKSADAAIFAENVGEGFELVAQNLDIICKAGVPVLIRIPVIPNVNDSETEMMKIINLLSRFPAVRDVELLAYHRTGCDKYRRMGRPYLMGEQKSLPEKELEPLKQLLRQHSFHVVES